MTKEIIEQNKPDNLENRYGKFYIDFEIVNDDVALGLKVTENVFIVHAMPNYATKRIEYVGKSILFGVNGRGEEVPEYAPVFDENKNITFLPIEVYKEMRKLKYNNEDSKIESTENFAKPVKKKSKKDGAK